MSGYQPGTLLIRRDERDFLLLLLEHSSGDLALWTLWGYDIKGTRPLQRIYYTHINESHLADFYDVVSDVTVDP